MAIKKEIAFWNEVMSYNSECLMESLTYKEKELNSLIAKYPNAFISLNNDLESIDNEKLKTIKALVTELVQFQKNLLNQLLKKEVSLSLTPTILNNMINEAMEYYLFLSLVNNQFKFDPCLELLRIHKMWLITSLSNTNTIISQLDITESVSIKKACDFKEAFNSLYLEATQLYLLCERVFNNHEKIDHFNDTVTSLVKAFISFLQKLKILKTEGKLLSTGTFTIKVLNHMIKEEEYYLQKLRDLNES